MSIKKISFIIVNYNTSDLLRKCIDNLIDIWPNMEIIVVDNGSTDDSVDDVSYYQQKGIIDLIANENIGLAAAHNKALARASGDYICYLGTDAYPDKDTIKILFGFMELSEEAGLITPKLVLKTGEPDWDAHRGFPTPWTAITHFLRLDRVFWKSKLFNGYFQGWKNFNSPHEIDVCISHFMFTKKEIYEKGITWDEDYFVFGEDVDFCYQIKQAGYKIFYLPQVEVLHYKGATIGRKTAQNIGTNSEVSLDTKLRMAKASTHAMRVFYKKHLVKKYPKIITQLVLKLIELIEYFRVFRVKISN